MFVTAPVVVLAPADDLEAQLEAGSAAVALGAPLLLVGRTSEGAATSGAATSGAAADGAAASGAAAGDPSTAATPVEDAWRTEVHRLQAVAVLEVGALDVEVPGLTVAHAQDAAALASLVGGAPTPVARGGEADAGARLDRTHPVLLVAAPGATPEASPEASTHAG